MICGSSLRRLIWIRWKKFIAGKQLLDLSGSQETMGKKTGKDAEAGKQTYPSVIGQEASQQRANDMIEQAIAAIEIFGEAGAPLKALANFVINRTRSSP